MSDKLQKLIEYFEQQYTVSQPSSSLSAMSGEGMKDVLTKQQFIDWFYNKEIHGPYWPTPVEVYDKLTEQYFNGGKDIQKTISESKLSSLLTQRDGELKQLLNDVYQLISGFALDDSWSEWDESVRRRVVELQKKLNKK